MTATRPPGRPRTIDQPKPITILFPTNLIEQTDLAAAELSVSRAQYIRSAVEAALAQAVPGSTS